MRDMKPTLVPPTGHHFFATSFASWHTSTDLVALIKKFEQEAHPFLVFYVPLPEESNYEIQDFSPQVEGVIELAYYGVGP